MNEHIRPDRLQDYVDDLLCREERAEVERHLLTCEECAREVGALRDLVAELHALPLAHAPARDLRPDIRAAIDAAPPAAGRSWASAGRRVLLAATVAGVAATGAWWGVRHTPRPASPPGSSTLAVEDPALRQIERDYQDAAVELQRTFATSPAALRPETRRILAENLAVIDRALAEARAALADDPGNPVLESILLANHEKKLELLRGASRAGT